MSDAPNAAPVTVVPSANHQLVGSLDKSETSIEPSVPVNGTSSAQDEAGQKLVVEHPSRDQLLTRLAKVDGAIGELVRHYPGRAQAEGSSAWLDNWFRNRVAATRNELPDADVVLGIVPTSLLSPMSAASDARPVRLLSVEPRYFRGFRTLVGPIDLSASLTVIDGDNSSGKTSLAEALEWLFTGQLIRRSLKDQGNARELEGCITNEFRPTNEHTWVEAVLGIEGSETAEEGCGSSPSSSQSLMLRRVLVEDYGSTSTASCRSVLYADGVELSKADEDALLLRLFAGCPPVLMQHSLRLFVHSAPSDRRQYFERLLQLDELTHLIEKAVITDNRLPDFRSPTASVAHQRWELLKQQVRQASSKTGLRRVEKLPPSTMLTGLATALEQVANSEFANVLGDDVSLAPAAVQVQQAQQAVRQDKFPLLAALRPSRIIDESLLAIMASDQLQARMVAVTGAEGALGIARQSAAMITAADLAVARAFAELGKAGLLKEPEDGDQVCPVCVFGDQPTLTSSRRTAIAQVGPVRAALELAEKNLVETLGTLGTWLSAARRARLQLVPVQPIIEDWEKAVEPLAEPVRSAAIAVRAAAERANEVLASFDESIAAAVVAATPAVMPEKSLPLLDSVTMIAEGLATVIECGHGYAATFTALEQIVGAQAKADPDYNLRELWLNVANDLQGTIEDLLWERAKKETQGCLEKVREALKETRQALLEQRRLAFSNGMTEIWRVLRSDRYSSFSQLVIPPPRGRGFPIEIEVKALLDDSKTTQEVDALRVFSESQVHVLGLAAFITRAKLLGHGLLILDDPVQSMDEDHFITFASSLLPHLREAGFQVVVLTHNKIFARDVSVALAERQDYVALRIEHARRSGCRIQEGTRRLQNRLKRASDAVDESQLDDGWLQARKGIERLYLLIRLKYGASGFKPVSWVNHTIENMWEEAVAAIIAERAPEVASRLKEILTLSNAGGHDKDTRGATDLELAIKDLRAIATTLQIHD